MWYKQERHSNSCIKIHFFLFFLAEIQIALRIIIVYIAIESFVDF